MKHTAYEPRDLVWVDLPALARQKLSPKWTGPFKVLQRLDSGTCNIGVDYELLDQRDPRAKPKVIHYNRLKPYRSAWSAEQSSPSPTDTTTTWSWAPTAHCTVRVQVLCVLGTSHTRLLCESSWSSEYSYASFSERYYCLVARK